MQANLSKEAVTYYKRCLIQLPNNATRKETSA